MKTIFFKNFLKNWKQVGSVTPSSRFLTTKMLKTIDFSKELLIVELGPGTGVFTEEILCRMGPNSKLTVLETNHDFVNHLRRIRDERFNVLEVSADNLSSVLKGEKVNIIVSGIPFLAIKKEVREVMLQEIKSSLKSGGKFIQFQYSLDLYEFLKKIFDNNVKISFVSLNIPPAFVYTCVVK
ncbi:MAG: methyltransferase [Candidatus Paceibacterota bacterium]|jgi:phospholipid N-methyltransferase